MRIKNKEIRRRRHRKEQAVKASKKAIALEFANKPAAGAAPKPKAAPKKEAAPKAAPAATAAAATAEKPKTAKKPKAESAS